MLAKSECFEQRALVAKGHSQLGSSSDVNFCGTLWDVNACELAEFSRGCKQADVLFARYGKDALPDGFWKSAQCGRAEWTENSVFISEKKRTDLVETSAFGVALQGAAHLAGDQSYLADRALFVASLGHLVVSNNPVIQHALRGFEDLFVYSKDVGTLCGTASIKARTVKPHRRVELITHIAEHHTYASRFADIANLLVRLNLPPLPAVRRRFSVQEKPLWCNELPNATALTEGIPKFKCVLKECGCGPTYSQPWCFDLVEGQPEAEFWCSKYKTKTSCDLNCGSKRGDSLWCEDKGKQNLSSTLQLS